jgi:hypothetical protein
VKAAAARVGMSRETAYRLRRKRGAASFCAAWDAIMGDAIMGGPNTPRPKVSLDPLFQRIRYGLYRPVMRSGRYVGTLKKPDNAALRSALSRADRTVDAALRRAETAEGRTKEKGRSA